MRNRNNLHQTEAVKKMQELIEDIDVCLFCTDIENPDGSTARPMSTQKVDEEGNIWFFSGRDSEKNKEIAVDNKVQLFYADNRRSSYVALTGIATISYDRKKIEEFWKPLVRIWFRQGKDDPNISLIKVAPSKLHYWDTKGSKMVNFFKMLASAATGTTLVDARERELQV